MTGIGRPGLRAGGRADQRGLPGPRLRASLRLAVRPRPALFQPPLADPGVVARQEDLRHRVAAPVERPRVVRILGRALQRDAERLLDRALLMAEGAGELANDD